jgi:hypothetical protein
MKYEIRIWRDGKAAGEPIITERTPNSSVHIITPHGRIDIRPSLEGATRARAPEVDVSTNALDSPPDEVEVLGDSPPNSPRVSTRRKFGADDPRDPMSMYGTLRGPRPRRKTDRAEAREAAGSGQEVGKQSARPLVSEPAEPAITKAKRDENPGMEMMPGMGMMGMGRPPGADAASPDTKGTEGGMSMSRGGMAMPGMAAGAR